MRNKAQKLTICDYVANKEPYKSLAILKDSPYEFENPQSIEELARSLKEYVAMDRDLALKKIAEIHPDKELIQSLDREVVDSDFKGNSTMMQMGQDYANPFHRGKTIYQNANGCGCSGSINFDGNQCRCMRCAKMYNADGETKKDYVPLIVTIGFFALLYMIIDKR